MHAGLLTIPRVCKIKPHVVYIVLKRVSRPAGEKDRRNGRTFFYVTKKDGRGISPEFVIARTSG